VKLQPKRNVFFEVGPVKSCLEENLRKHSTITVGDVLTVWFRGRAYQLTVTAVRPEPVEGELFQGCSLIDADVEVDLDVSEESSTKLTAPTAVPHGDVSGTSPSPAVKETNSSFIAAPQLDNVFLEDLERQLGPEPPTGEAVLLKMKLPSGVVVLRRFSPTASLRQLLLFVTYAAQVSTADRDLLLSPLPIQLSVRSSFPPTNIRLLHPVHSQADNDLLLDRTLSEAGIKTPQDSIFITVIN